MVGFDLEQSKFIIKVLAEFHGTSYSLKQKNPRIFNKNVKAYINSFHLPEREQKTTINAWRTTLEESVETASFAQKILDKLEKHSDYQPREPFATLSHYDLWVNNVMVKSSNGKTQNVKFVDFQFIDYRSLVSDLIHFVFTSISTHILQNHLDELFEHFYYEFTKTVLKFNCKTPFPTLNSFFQEIADEANHAELFHIAYMTMVIFAPKENVKEVTEFKEKDGIFGEVSTFQKEKIKFLALEFVKRNWI